MMRRFRWPWRPSIDERRWVVLDAEASGLDPSRDRLISIAAVALAFDAQGARMVLNDSFEVVLRQDSAPPTPDKPNILLHRIGTGAQASGVDPSVALRSLMTFLGTSPVLAFHAAFDRILIGRATEGVLGTALANPWLDIEHLAAVVHPDIKARSLDEWMAALDIRCDVRHQAAADAMASAEVFLRLWPRLVAQGADSFDATRRLALRHRWLR